MEEAAPEQPVEDFGAEGDQAAARLQAVTRGRNQRKADQEKAEQTASAQRIQAISRGRKGREKAALKQQQDAATAKLQSIQRGRLQRKMDKTKKEGGQDLDTALIRKGLSNLGRNPITLQHAFLDFNCAESSVKAIEGLRSYPHLQTLDLHDNVVEDLKPLEALPYLTALNASSNKLKSCLQFFPPRCNPDTRWNTGDASLGSVLADADLSSNEIPEMASMAHHTYLRSLVIDDNLVTSIAGVAGLKFLKTLSISNNKLEAIGGLDDLPLETLDLSGNAIKKLENLEKLPSLVNMNMADNQIETLDGLDKLEKLQILNMGGNRVKSILEVQNLTANEYLRELTLSDNPCAASEDEQFGGAPPAQFYRRRVLVRLTKLTMLDSTLVTAEEKVSALNLHAVEGSDLENRSKVFSEHFGDSASFANTLPPFSEQ